MRAFGVTEVAGGNESARTAQLFPEEEQEENWEQGQRGRSSAR